MRTGNFFQVFARMCIYLQLEFNKIALILTAATGIATIAS